MTIREQIEAVEKQLNALKEQERKEKEETQKNLAAEKEKELTALKEVIAAFNKKHNEHIFLAEEVRDIFFSWWREV